VEDGTELSTPARCTVYVPSEDGWHWKVYGVVEMVTGVEEGVQPGGVLLNHR